MGFAAVDDEFLDGGMTEGDGCPAENQRHETPGEKMGCNEKGAGRDKKE